MNFKINSTEFYSRQNQEIKRFLNVEKKTLHICINQDNLFLDKEKLDVLALENQKDVIQSIFKLEKKYDLIIITDLFEVSSDIYELLKTTRDKLNNNGKILISTINPKWRRVLRFSEIINIKKQIRKSSNTKLKKIVSSARSSGLELNYFYTKQIFPFKLLGFGRVLNKALELIFFKFNLGIKSYILFSNITFLKTEMSKSVIVPAKNESKNLEILFESFPKLSSLNEIILICAESKDNTLEMGKDISKKKSDLKIKVIEQESKGKAGAVFEALEHTTGELIAILDSDISVEPETLPSFFEIIESGHGDFVNGTRLIYPIENKSMRFLNRLGNKFFKFAVSSVIRNPLSDSLCGTKVFRRSHINRIISWRKDLNNLDPFGDFDFLFSAAYYGEKISEYPVHYKARIYGKTQINRFRDGFKLIYYFFKSFSKFNSSIN
tara:strand:+ start:1331 stop:2641 length:1311 start_codon:yes stop_codon:yes gene_type:complete